MLKRSHRWSIFAATSIPGVVLLISTISQSISPTLAGEAPAYTPIADRPTTATYSDTNQPDLVIHATSNSTSIAEPPNSPDKIQPVAPQSESDRTPRSSQLSPSTPLDDLQSDKN
jgi:hypothetical protein